MAMTKKERAEYDAAISEARIAGALRWSTPIEPVVPIPARRSDIVNGWHYTAYESGRVDKACTSSVKHSYGHWDMTTTQRPTRLYSTKLLALKALRHALERQAAGRLARIDELIAAELSHSASTNQRVNDV